MAMIPWRSKQRESNGPETASLATWRGEMDRLFESFFREPFGALDWPFAGRGRWMPPVDVSETGDEVLIRAELPGMDPKDLDITVTGNQLVLSGEKKESDEQKGRGYYHSETRYGSFRRTIPLPEGVDPQSGNAEYNQGVLTLRLKRTPAAAPKRIEVRAK